MSLQLLYKSRYQKVNLLPTLAENNHIYELLFTEGVIVCHKDTIASH